MSLHHGCCRESESDYCGHDAGSKLELNLHFACVRNQLSNVKDLLTCASGLKAINTQPVEIIERGTRYERGEETIQVGTRREHESYVEETYDLGGWNYDVTHTTYTDVPVYETRKYCNSLPFVKYVQHSAPIFVAAQYGNIGIVKHLAMFGECNLDIMNDIGDTPLHVACKKGYLDIVRFLVQKECNLNVKNAEGNTPLCTALYHEQWDITKVLLTEAHCDVSCVEYRRALHGACTHGRLDIVKLLFRNPKYDINIKDSNRSTPLHSACKGGRLDLVEFLLSKANCDTTIKDTNGSTPLHVSCRKGHTDDIVYGKECHINCRNGHGNTPLHIACEEGCLDIVKLLLSNPKCDIAIVNSYDDTPLHVACRKGHTDTVQCLIEKECHVNCRNRHGNTPLHNACEEGCLDTVKLLLSNPKCDIAIVNSYDDTPLHVACRKGHTDTVQCLIEKECHINCRNRHGNTPLHIACEEGCLDIVKLLLSKPNCDINLKVSDGVNPLHIASACRFSSVSSYHFDCRNKTPIQIAYARGHLNIVKLLLREPNCDVNLKDSNDDTPLHVACRKGHTDIVQCIVEKECHINCKNRHGNTPLHIACEEGCLDIVKLLLSKPNCDINLKVSDGVNPLHIASACRFSSVSSYHFDCRNKTPIQIAYARGHLNIVKLLLREPNCDVNLKDSNDDTPLHVACRKGHTDIVQCIVEKECHINCRNRHGNTPLHNACEEGCLDTVKLLLSNPKCDIAIVNSYDDTPLHVACRKGHTDTVQCLIEKECHINCRNRHGNTPLHIACEEGCLDIVKLLLSKPNCDINLKVSDGVNPLHIASACKFSSVSSYHFDCRNKTPIQIAYARGHLNIVKLLLREPNCDVNLKDSNDDTPLHVACRKGHTDIVQCIVEKECHINCRNRHGNTPLHIACEEGCLDIVKLLLSKPNCDINLKVSDGVNPLHIASACRFSSVSSYHFDCRNKTPIQIAYARGHLNIVKLLLREPNCDVNLKDSNDDTPLHVACRKGHTDIVQCIVEKECHINCRNRHGNTPLHIACEEGCLDIVKLLLSSPNCDINIKDSNGGTPLHAACNSCNLRIVRALLATGKADPTIRNDQGKSPLEMTYDYTITREVAVYARATLKLKKKNPLGSYVQVFIVGYAAAGKTTLIEVLRREAAVVLKYLPKAVAPNTRTFRDAKPNTPGIVPHQLKSKQFGAVVIHDLAGQCEHYSSHAAIVENSVLTSAPLFVIVINLCEENESIERRLSYWLSFIKNHCKKATTPPHVTIVGSHQDEVKPKDEQKKLSIIREALPTESPLHFTEPPAVALDCRNVASKGLDKLRSTIKSSCLALRKDQNVYFGCHALYGFLHQFEKLAFTVKDVLSKIQEEDVLLPQTVPGLIELLSALNDKGLLLLLKNTSDPAGSWVIFQKGKLLSEVNGKLFAPEYKSTGVVSLSGIRNEFPQYDPIVLITLLTHLEFCHEMDEYAKSALDAQMSSENMHNREEEYFLFPGLITTERPDIWSVMNSKDKEKNEYCCGWILHCTESEELLETRFIHVLLLRLAFSFPLVPEDKAHAPSCLPAITRCCKIWKNGIRWLTEIGGIETIVEILEENRSLVLSMNCGKEYKDSCAKLRSEVIVEILKAKNDFCESVSTKKYLINCSQDLHELSLFSIINLVARVHNRIVSHAVDTEGEKAMLIEKLLGFEPYISIDRNIVQQVLSKGDTDTPVPTELLSELDENCAKYLHFHEHFKKYKENQDLTFQTLRHEVFDKFSIFDAQFHKVSVLLLVYKTTAQLSADTTKMCDLPTYVPF